MTKDFSLEIKQMDLGLGQFVGLASVYGNVDLGGDVVERGAFAKTLAANREVPMLWQHDVENPIGLVELEDSSKGLIAKGTIDLDVPEGQRAFKGLRRGYLKGLSIGYSTIKDAMLANCVRRLLEVSVYEVSVVTFPMNPLAAVTTVKQQDAEYEAFIGHFRKINQELRGEIQHMRDGDQRKGADHFRALLGRMRMEWRESRAARMTGSNGR